MSPDPRHRRPDRPRRATRVHALMLLAALATGASAMSAWTAAPTGPTATPESGVALVAADPEPPVGPRPVRIEIPAIEVNADLEELHRQFDGALSTPVEWANAGWYAEGVLPGERGPAVVAGHLDSAAGGPAVFYRLPELTPGDEIFVARSDGARQRFVVAASRSFAKTEFPTALVYGPTALPELRLVTCIGAFDAAARSYVDNLVVTAHAA